MNVEEIISKQENVKSYLRSIVIAKVINIIIDIVWLMFYFSVFYIAFINITTSLIFCIFLFAFAGYKILFILHSFSVDGDNSIIEVKLKEKVSTSLGYFSATYASSGGTTKIIVKFNNSEIGGIDNIPDNMVYVVRDCVFIACDAKTVLARL